MKASEPDIADWGMFVPGNVLVLGLLVSCTDTTEANREVSSTPAFISERRLALEAVDTPEAPPSQVPDAWQDPAEVDVSNTALHSCDDRVSYGRSHGGGCSRHANWDLVISERDALGVDWPDAWDVEIDKLQQSLRYCAYRYLPKALGVDAITGRVELSVGIDGRVEDFRLRFDPPHRTVRYVGDAWGLNVELVRLQKNPSELRNCFGWTLTRRPGPALSQPAELGMTWTFSKRANGTLMNKYQVVPW